MPEQSRAKLNTILEEIQTLLESSDDLDDSARDALRDAADDIQTALDGEDGWSAQVDAVRTRIARFETEHPTLTEAVRRLVDQLSEMGI